MEKPEYLYVLDFSIPDIYEINLNDIDGVESYENTDDILTLFGLKESQCAYMYSQEKLELKTIEPIQIRL